MCFVFFSSQAVTSGKYLDSCLNMLISNFLPPSSHPRVLNKKIEVLSRVHAALLKISILVPLTPSRLVPMLSQKMPKLHKKDHVSLFFLVNFGHCSRKLILAINSKEIILPVLQLIVIYVESLLKLENSSIGQVGGSMILNMVTERLRDLDVSRQNMFIQLRSVSNVVLVSE